jgi:uncharacterized protein (TIGR03118 family)
MSLINYRTDAPGKGILALAVVLMPFLASCGSDHSPAAPVTPPSIGSLTVTPTTILRGQSATITWSTSNTSTCTASGSWSGVQAATGTVSVTPTAEGKYTYSLLCFGMPGTGTAQSQQSATLTVNGSAYSVTPLVSDMAGVAAHQDANLVNPWGIVAGPTTPFWVANQGGNGTSTLYGGNGAPIPLVVTLGATFAPTGIVYNINNGTGGTTADFQITTGTPPVTGPSAFIFSGIGGMIAGWGGVNRMVTFPGSSGAHYTGLAIASAGGSNYLYATDFANSKIDVFNGSFALQSWPASAFVDSGLPSGYAPFGIQAIASGTGGATQLYVTYAPQTGGATAGAGLVDLYDTSGKFIKRLIDKGGSLNQPWGVAWAPAVNFGTASGTLLVGNLGDGAINEFDPVTGAWVGTLSDANGRQIAYPGLWGIAFGNDHQNQPATTLFFAAGVNHEMDGIYGRIDLGATPPTLP